MVVKARGVLELTSSGLVVAQWYSSTLGQVWGRVLQALGVDQNLTLGSGGGTVIFVVNTFENHIVAYLNNVL